MNWRFYGIGLALSVAFVIWVAGCSREIPRKTNLTGESDQEVDAETTKLAVEEEPERLGDQQSEDVEVVVEIPLNQIRHGTPGSRQLRDLEPEFFVYRETQEKVAEYSTPEGLQKLEGIQIAAKEQSLVLAIEEAMASLPGGREVTTSPGFVVEGTDRAALQGVYDVLVKGQQPVDEFPAGTEVSVVFFARPAQPLIGFDRIERKGNRVEIRYMLIAHGLSSVTWNLALIPLGKLPSGEYLVEFIRSLEKEKDFNQRDFALIERGIEEQLICQSFSFSVVDRETD